MKVICAGFPKTGTKSMAMALRELGYSVHDVEEHLQLNMDSFLNFLEGECDSTELMEKHRDVDAVVDIPSVTLWHSFFQHYPDSKVILMLRESPEVWFKSFSDMMDYHGSTMPCYYEYVAWFSDTRRKFDQLMRHAMARNSGAERAVWFGRDMSKENAINQYILHNAAVQHLVPPEQLLVYHVEEGWEPICKFLDKPVPATPFPRENAAGQAGNIIDKLFKFTIYEDMDKEVRQSFLKIGGCFAALAGAGAYFFM